jgi:hypothetical protein
MNRSIARRTVVSLAVAFAAFTAAALLAPSAAEARGLGLRGGFSLSPDQIVLGAHLQLPQIAEKLEFMPSAEIGFGDDLTSFALNGDFKYHFAPDNKLDPYAGAGLTANWFDGEGEFGGNLLGGIHVADRIFIEGKVGLGDVPDAKFMAGLTF